MKKKIFMAGVGGMLGEAFYYEFSNDYDLYCTDKDVNEKWLNYLDFCEKEKYKSEVLKFNPDYLFHIGAFTDLEYCEKNKDETIETNKNSVISAVEICNELKIPILYISTAGIFDGQKEQYDEIDTPKPIGVYASSKYEAEKYVIKNCEKYIICRAGWMMGGGPRKDKKFIQKIMKQIKDGKRELHVVNDKLGTPTYTMDFARNVELLIEREYWGIYNMVCGGVTERLEVAKELIRIIGKDSEIKVTPVSSDYFAKEYHAKRPYSERLITKKLELRDCNIMRDWRICLREYLDTYYKNYLN